MDIKQALRAADRMGTRAGSGYRRSGLPQRNPFPTDAAPALTQIARAWDRAYVTAAYSRPPGSPPPTASAPGSADSADQTATMTAAATTPAATARAAEAAQLGSEADQALLAAGDGPNTGACLMAFLAAGDAQRLAVPGGEAPEDMHVTLAYLANPAADYSDEVRTAVDAALARAWVQPVAAEAFGLAQLNPDSAEREPCAVLLVQSDDLANCRDAMLAALDELGDIDSEWTVELSTTFPIWVPHVTVGYNIDPAEIPPGATGPLTFDRLIMAWGDDQHDLTNPADAPALTAATEEPPMTAPAATEAPTPAADPATAAPAETPEGAEAGPTWSGPLALLGVPSSDGRKLGPNGTIRPLPQPLNWQHKSDDRHKGSSVVGACLQVEIRDGTIWGHGNWLPGWGDVETARTQVDAGLGLVSVDVVPGVVSYEDRDGNPIDPATFTGDFDDIVVVFDEWEFGGVTIVSFPAFADARITTDPGTESDDSAIGGPYIMPGETQTFAGEATGVPTASADGTSITLTDGSTVKVGDTVGVPAGDDGTPQTGTITEISLDAQTVDVTLAADAADGTGPATLTVPIADLTSATEPLEGTPAAAPTFAAGQPAAADGLDALLASSYARPYPAAAFAKRELLGPTPLTVNRDTGEIYGHFAVRGDCHMGKLAQDGVCVTPPESQCGYDYFHLGEVLTDDGTLLPVGKITVGGGHAGPRAGFRGAVEHYDRTCSQVAVVRAYDDAYGGQVTGMLIHDVPGEKVDELMRAGQLSGDWRTMKGNLELVAALGVNVPGFPVKRPAPKYGMLGPHQVSLVAAGIVAPEEYTDVVLPSGLRVPRGDWETLVAAAYTAIEQHRPQPAEVAAMVPVDELALRRARARLALSGAVNL